MAGNLKPEPNETAVDREQRKHFEGQSLSHACAGRPPKAPPMFTGAPNKTRPPASSTSSPAAPESLSNPYVRPARTLRHVHLVHGHVPTVRPRDPVEPMSITLKQCRLENKETHGGPTRTRPDRPRIVASHSTRPPSSFPSPRTAFVIGPSNKQQQNDISSPDLWGPGPCRAAVCRATRREFRTPF